MTQYNPLRRRSHTIAKGTRRQVFGDMHDMCIGIKYRMCQERLITYVLGQVRKAGKQKGTKTNNWRKHLPFILLQIKYCTV